MRYFYDCEFIEDGRTVDLISIGIVAEDGREYYAVNSDMPFDRIRAHDWLMRNVVPSLPIVGQSSLGKWMAHPANSYPRPSTDTVAIDTGDARVKPHWVIRNEVHDFLIGDFSGAELWAWYAAYDHVVLAQLFGPMIQLPDGVPMWTNDLQQELARRGITEDRLPQQASGLHNALSDAHHVRDLYNWLHGPIAQVA